MIKWKSGYRRVDGVNEVEKFRHEDRGMMK